jgi:murein DD-endopeptidase MepM/ murein hydrolase activator NlpD
VLSGVVTNNNGIDIRTEEAATVRCIYDGTVVGITFNPTFQKAVLVRHGDYFTVYSNLSETYVKVGDMVTTKQQIGKVYSSSGSSEVHLEVWKETTPLNPGEWVKAN